MVYGRALSFWLSAYERFDAERPPAQREWRVPRYYSPVARIEQLLDFPVGTPRVLLTGTTGSGKSTEVRARRRVARVA